MEITALVPIKINSERLKGKNFRLFCGQPLFQIILDKLQAIEFVKEIVIDTDSEQIAEDCSKRYSKSKIITRPAHLSGNDITMNSIIEYDLSIVSGDHFLQTHCTNPVISIKTIESAIAKYFKNLSIYDSLISAYLLQKRIYTSEVAPINHTMDRMDQTQNLAEIYVENSNLFLFSRDSFNNNGQNRVGKRAQLFPMNYIEGIDIDYLEDFKLAELICKNLSLFDSLN